MQHQDGPLHAVEIAADRGGIVAWQANQAAFDEDGATREHGLPPEPPSAAILSLASVWRQFVEGSLTALDAFCGPQRCYVVVVVAKEPPCQRTKCDDDLAVLRRILGGEMQKCVAIERECSPSTVTHATRNSLRRFGFECTARRTPVLLTLAACADELGSTTAVARSTPLVYPSSARFLISTERPDRTLPDCLSPAEREVVRGVVEGLSNAEIAGERKAERTVANQLASIFKKLEVGTRCELVWELARASVTSGPRRVRSPTP